MFGRIPSRRRGRRRAGLRSTRVALLLALLPGVIGAGLIRWPPAESLERAGLDLLFPARGEWPAPDGVCVVAIDTDSYEALGVDRKLATWPRGLHAELIQVLHREGAAAVGFDVLEAVREYHERLPSAAVDADEEKRQRKGKKQMAYVGAVYTIDRFPRTAEDVLDEMARRTWSQERPRPQHKRVWAEMTRIVEGEACSGRERLFCGLAMERDQRDPQRNKTLICLMDGERSLWDMQRYWFRKAIGILDIFHVSQRIWDVAHCLQARESEAARQFATYHLRMILNGKVVYVLRNLRPLLKRDDLRGEKRKTVSATITYFGIPLCE